MNIHGKITGITYSNKETGWTVADFRIDKQDHDIRIVGELCIPMVGDKLDLYGEWMVHPKFGRQFKVSDYTIFTFKKEYLIVKFLSSGLIKGIGPKLAGRIVSRFKQDTFYVIEKHPRRLMEVKGISKQTADQIIQSWSNQR